jgi:hypothetical protein
MISERNVCIDQYTYYICAESILVSWSGEVKGPTCSVRKVCAW